MKKFLLLTIPALIGLFVISSCSITLTKRHYRSGYFVEHRKTLKNTSAMGSVTVFEPPVSLNMDLTPPLFTAVQVPMIKKEPQMELHKKKGLSAEYIPFRPAIKAHKKTEHLQAKDFFSVPKMKQTAKASADKIISPEAGALGTALSLLWIVIVTLIVIYIVGLVLNGYGFGSLIHILLIVILLLAVLWLLKVL